MKIFLIILVVISGAVLIAAAAYVYHNLNYYKAPLRRITKAGFVEKQAVLEDGSTLNYGEGPNSGPALLLLHGQGVSWEDYASVLPVLSNYYHIYAMDYYGHGGSSKNPEKYYAEVIGADLVWFIKNVIGEPVVLSGHSSGGLLAAWLAANSPENILGIVLEDPPLFTTEAGQYEDTFAWNDSFEPIHRFLQQEEEDYPLFYLKNSYWINFFGESKEKIINYAASFREKHPDQKLEIFFLPPSITRIFYFMEDYDPKFGDTFYDASWNRNFNHAETLARIDCPSIYIHTNWRYDENSILLGAVDGEDAQRIHEMIKDNAMFKFDCGHDMHYEKPEEFIKIMVEFLDKIQ